MKEKRYFLSDIFTTENPVSVKVIDLETGESITSKVIYFRNNKKYFPAMDDEDIFRLGVLLGQEMTSQIKIH